MRARVLFCLLVCAILLPVPAWAAEWETWKGCSYLPNDYNDGDSFHIRHDGQEYIVRLYFVDAPETDLSFPDRVAEQAQHHGKTEEETMHVGKYAGAVTAQVLSRPFKVLTRRQDARGRSALPRFYAFVTTSDGEDLGELLVENGLARSFGTAANAPGKESTAGMRARYDALEQSARKKQLGIYSPSPLKSINRAPTTSKQTPPPQPQTTPKNMPKSDSLGFLTGPELKIPDMNIAPVEAAPEAEPQKTKAPSSEGKININTASQEELQSLPGVGPKFAEKIIESRPYGSVEDLRYLPRIPHKTLDAIIPLCTVD